MKNNFNRLRWMMHSEWFVLSQSRKNTNIHFLSLKCRDYFNTILCNFKGEHFPKSWAICDANDSNTLLLSIEKLKANKYCRGILKFNVSKFVLPYHRRSLVQHSCFHCRIFSRASLILNRSIWLNCRRSICPMW